MRKHKLDEKNKNDKDAWTTGSGKRKPKTSWLDQNRVAYGYVTLLIGLPESGKTTYLAALAAQQMGGPKLFKGSKDKGQRVMWLQQEEDYNRDIVPRIRTAGGDHKKLIYPLVDEEAMEATLLCFPQAEERVIRAIQQKKIGLLIVDSLVDSMCPGLKLKEYGDMSAFMLSLIRIGKKTGVAVVITHHAKKGHTGPPMEAPVGSQAFAAKARICIHAFKDDKDRDKYRLAIFKRGPGAGSGTLEFRTEKVNGVPKLVSPVERDETAEELARKEEDTGKRAAIEEGKKVLQDFLKDGAQYVHEVEKAGRERARVELLALRVALKELGGYAWPHRIGDVNLSFWHLADVECKDCAEGRRRKKSIPPHA